MPLFRFDDTLILFIHVPKTGGTSVEQALRAMGGRAALLCNTTDGYARCTPQHMQAEILSAFVPEGFYDMRFAVIREPQSRLVSEYKMRRAGRKLRGMPLLSFTDWVDQTFRRYERNPYVFDNHIRPQTELIPEHTQIFRLEDGLEVALAHVARRLGRAAPALDRVRPGAPDPVEIPPATAARVAAFYRADYDRFGYGAPRPD
ncbi:sulfotransferase family 2 domain-containing protein [Roseovarius atlanticus]|uniref:sulfotransferase family 2 domain-containing protein n=1 Tax=Roseovarius atlanticus TaxID=1641875 RepID=UPI001C97E562|nr:sulfotransferase family 2 domain-containing protein [Roseovarius atlanticus]MBY6127059.1 sulfotransferase family protein [Roseovarius atlanticus]MBY6151553.1 sulfotransferase family protein [Roseovarius atlanticus]